MCVALYANYRSIWDNTAWGYPKQNQKYGGIQILHPIFPYFRLTRQVNLISRTHDNNNNKLPKTCLTFFLRGGCYNLKGWLGWLGSTEVKQEVIKRNSSLGQTGNVYPQYIAHTYCGWKNTGGFLIWSAQNGTGSCEKMLFLYFTFTSTDPTQKSVMGAFLYTERRYSTQPQAQTCNKSVLVEMTRLNRGDRLTVVKARDDQPSHKAGSQSR